MPKRTRIDVMHNKRDSNWVAGRGGEEHRFDRKADTVKASPEAGKMIGNAQVVIRTMTARFSRSARTATTRVAPRDRQTGRVQCCQLSVA